MELCVETFGKREPAWYACSCKQESHKRKRFLGMKTNELLFGTKEWVPINFNFMSGCSNDCSYYYAKDMTIRFKRKRVETWKEEQPVDLSKRSYAKRNGAIMIPSSHNITPGNVSIAPDVMRKLLATGNELLVVTKPHYSCTTRMVDTFLPKKQQIRFRFTIGSADSSVLKLWESGASDFEERLASVRYAYEKGYSTSIFCEPLLDAHFEVLYEAVEPFVTDAIWVGKMNMAQKRVKTNTQGTFPQEAIDNLLAGQDDLHIIALFKAFNEKPKIQWKESIKRVAIQYGLL